MKQPYDIVKVLYGSETYFKNTIGFCTFHHCFLTVRQLKTKGCLGKQCKCLDKNDHVYWKLREEKRLLKKNK